MSDVVKTAEEVSALVRGPTGTAVCNPHSPSVLLLRAAGGSLKPLFLLAFQKLNTNKDFSCQNLLFSQACPRFIVTPAPKVG